MVTTHRRATPSTRIEHRKTLFNFCKRFSALIDIFALASRAGGVLQCRHEIQSPTVSARFTPRTELGEHSSALPAFQGAWARKLTLVL
jgi:hypothetical protein